LPFRAKLPTGYPQANYMKTEPKRKFSPTYTPMFHVEQRYSKIEKITMRHKAKPAQYQQIYEILHDSNWAHKHAPYDVSRETIDSSFIPLKLAHLL
jgi:hypothetical protein